MAHLYITKNEAAPPFAAYQHKLMTLSLDEFLRRFLLHLLPKGFVRISPLRSPGLPAPCRSPAALLSITRLDPTTADRARDLRYPATELALILSNRRSATLPGFCLSLHRASTRRRAGDP